MDNRIDIDFERLCSMENIKTARVGERHFRHNWISLPCPFCTGDEGNHLGYSRESKVFTCWRCGRHTIGEVLASLLNMSKRDAVRYAMTHYPTNPFAEPFIAYKPKRKRVLELIGSKIPSQIHIDYLTNRRYCVEELIDKWDLRFTLDHESHGYRIIFPIWYDGRYVSYVGRDVSGVHPKKYLTCFPENEVVSNKDCVWGVQRATKGTVIVVEGVFDAIRIGEGVIATLGTSTNLKQAQEIAKRFKSSYILFDNEADAQARARKFAETLGALNPNHKSRVISINNPDINDPSELPDEIVTQIRGLII